MSSEKKVLCFNEEQQKRSVQDAQHWHKRHAVQLAAQLPDNKDDARLVMACLKSLLEGYLFDEERQD